MDVAFRVCRDIGCPHPSQLERFDIGVDELIDWWGFYLHENQPGDQDDANGPDEFQMLSDFKKQTGEMSDNAN